MPSLQHSSWTPLPRVMAMLRGNKRCNGHENLRQGVEHITEHLARHALCVAQGKAPPPSAPAGPVSCFAYHTPC